MAITCGLHQEDGVAMEQDATLSRPSRNMPTLYTEVIQDRIGNHEYIPQDRKLHSRIETNGLKDVRMPLRPQNQKHTTKGRTPSSQDK